MVAIMATIILIATLATLIFAFAAYFITKAKRKKGKKVQLPEIDEGQQTRRYFERYSASKKIVYGKQQIIVNKDEAEQWT